MEGNENWFVQYWRPAMAWSYLAICLFDFLLFPILISLWCFYTKTPIIMWDPITLKGGAVYHASMGGVCGVTAWSRGREKIASMQADSSATPVAPTALAEISNIAQTMETPPSTVRRQGADQ